MACRQNQILYRGNARLNDYDAISFMQMKNQHIELTVALLRCKYNLSSDCG